MDAIAKPQSTAQFDGCQTVEDLTGLFREVLFNHRETRVTTDGSIPETTSQADLAGVLDSSPRDVPVVERSVSRTPGGSFAYSPADTDSRLEYLRKHPIAEGLNSYPDFSALIAQLSHATSDQEKSSLFVTLHEAVERKHVPNILKALPLLEDVKKQTDVVGYAFSLINKSDQFFYNKGDNNGSFNEQSLMFNVGILDALYSQLTDLSTLLKGELCTESLSVIRYINMIFPDPLYSLDTLKPCELEGYRGDPSHHKEQIALKSNWTPDDSRVTQVIAMIENYRETELGIYANISKASAKHLNDYLRANNIDRLFFPMAGTGYFCKSMIDAGMPSTCFDINPPDKTFITVNKADVFVSIDKFAKTLALTGRNIHSSALVLDAPQPGFMVQNRRIEADEFLPTVIKSWLDRGGKNVLVISEASDQALLFSSKALTRMGIAMIPVIPGFPPEIFQGLGEFVGICGLYRSEKK